MSGFVRYSINSLLLSKHFTLGLKRPANTVFAIKNKYSTQSAPKCGTVETEQSKTSQSTDEWTLIYRYKYILLARGLCRLKLYQTLFLTATTPLTIYSYSMGNITLENCTFFIGLNVFSCLTFYLFGNMFRKVVGIVYINEKSTKTKIAHLTFWGRRRDNVYNILDLAPLMDSNTGNELFCKIRSSSDDKVLYYISLKHGLIEDTDKFFNVFGTFGSD